MSVLASYSYKVSKEKSFPKLMIDENITIVLFNQEEKGVVVSNKVGIYNIGDYYNNWAMNCFKDYNGEVTLKNE